MRRPERVHSRIVDQDIDVAVCKFDRSSRHFTDTRSASKIRRNEVRLSTRSTYFSNRLFATLLISTYDYYMYP